MSRMIELARAGRARVAPAPETYVAVSEQAIADDFIAWLREHDGAGWWATCEVVKLFEQFCLECDRPRLNMDRLRSCMLKYPGVYRARHRLRGAFEDIGKATGLERATLYWIPPSEPVAGPWPDPDRSPAGPCPDTGQPLASPWPAPGRPVATACPDNTLTGSEQQEVCEASIR